MIKKRYAEHVK